MPIQKKIRIVVLLGTISLIGLIITQIYWIDRSFDISEKELDQSIHIALITVSKKMAKFAGNESPNVNPVQQLSADYFVVNINDQINANILEHYLLQEFQKNGIKLEFEYGIYDCESDKMLYGNNLKPDDSKKIESTGELPTYDEYIYYFGVRFYGKKAFLAGDYQSWLFSSLILIIVIIFFSSTFYIILRQKKLSEIQKDFINNMTHEFKTPISTIKISSQALSKPNIASDPERLKKYVNIISSENERLLNQVNTVLQMANIENESNNLKIVDLDVNQIISEIILQIESRINEAGGSIQTKLYAQRSIIKGDELHFKNVITNLLDNAIKYSPDKPEITIETHSNASCLNISIIDKGIGISTENQKLIFTKFYRVPKGDVHDVKGFGLGLNYVWNIVKHHQWKIEVISDIGIGTNIILKIPF